MEDERKRYEDRIVSDPQIIVGKPTIRGTRVPVERALGYLSVTPSFEELFQDYPRLTLEDVQACFAYARMLVEEIGRRKAAPHLRDLHHAPE